MAEGQTIVLSEQTFRQQEVAKVFSESATRFADDVMPVGGRYMVDGRLVDANGEAIKERKPVSAEPEGDSVSTTVPELRALAEANDVDLDGVTRKDDIVARLRDAGVEVS